MQPRPRPRLLVTGASGYLGRRVCRLAEARCALIAAHGRSPERLAAGQPLALDLRDAEAVASTLEALRPEAVIHCAAVNPGGAESDMEAVNALGSAALARACARLGARLVHVSSDVVFDGRHAPYREAAPLTPLGAYGRSKAAGERAVAAACPEAVIVRTSLIYGLDEMDRQTEGFLARIEAGGSLSLWEDVIRQPIEAGSLAEALLELALDRPEIAGPLHLAGEQALNRYAFGLRLLRFWGLSESRIKHHVSAGRAADLDAPVALDLRLDLSRAQASLESRLPGADEVLARYEGRLA